MAKLLDRVRDRVRVLHYSIRTEDAYVDWIKRFILFHGKRHPQEMGAPELEAFLTHLAVDRKSRPRPRTRSCSSIAKSRAGRSESSARSPRPGGPNGCRPFSLAT